MRTLIAGIVLSACPLAENSSWTYEFASHYRVLPNTTYPGNNFEAKLDLYERHDVQDARPTLIYIHGGGWVGGTKEGALTRFFLISKWAGMS
jgi:acetyl esterase/lipase